MITEEMLKEDGLLIQHILKPTPIQRKLAVKQNPYAIQYIRVQTKELCVLAATLKPDTLQYFTNQYEAAVEIAIRKDPSLIRLVRRHTKFIVDLALSLDKSLEIYMHNPTRARFTRNYIENHGGLVEPLTHNRYQVKTLSPIATLMKANIEARKRELESRI